MDLALLQLTLRQFAAEREWQSFHTPKNLAMALMVEAAELAEIFQWMTPEQSLTAHSDRVQQEHIGDEVADVLLYLLQLADHSGIDLKRAVGRKLVKNAKKYPPTRPGAPAGPMASLPAQTHVLVDWENVQPQEADIRALVPDVTDVWIFHGKTQKRVEAHQKGFGEQLTLVPVSRPGKNALDFHLSFYMGYITSRNPNARFVVISNDQGYGPMLEHAHDLGFDTRLVGFSRVAAPTRGTATRTAARSRATSPRAPATPATPATPAATTRRTATRAPAPAQPPASPPSAPARPAGAKTGAARAATRARATPPVVAPEPAPAPAPQAARRTPRTATRKTARATTAASAPAADASAAPAPRPRASAKTRAPKASPAPVVDQKAYAHVLASLRKNRDKPTRRARLNSMVRSLLNGGQADAAAVEAVVQRLVADGHLSLTAQGAVELKV
jgi:NTP pyrophosphatase (non-canonical NTP hydrolase)